MAGLFNDNPPWIAPPIAGGGTMMSTAKKHQNFLYPGELEFFRANPSTAGMATEDGRVAINPFSGLSEDEMGAVRVNETARLLMRDGDLQPTFDLSDEQRAALSNTNYMDASPADQRATIAARILSGDPSAGTPTPDQLSFVQSLLDRMTNGMFGEMK